MSSPPNFFLLFLHDLSQSPKQILIFTKQSESAKSSKKYSNIYLQLIVLDRKWAICLKGAQADFFGGSNYNNNKKRVGQWAFLIFFKSSDFLTSFN